MKNDLSDRDPAGAGGNQDVSAVFLRFNFSSTLNSHKRRLVHKVGEKLVHNIVGEVNEKHIMLKKPGGNNVKDSNAASAIEGEDVTVKTEDQEEKKNKALAAGQGKVLAVWLYQVRT